MLKKIKGLLFENRSARQTVIKNAIWLSVAQIIGRLFRAVILIYAARALGAAEYGIFSYALGLATFFTIFADIGINSIMTREAAKYPDKRSQYFSSGFWIKLTLVLGTAAVIIFVAPLFSKIEAAKALMPLIALLVIFDGLRDFASAFFRAEEKMEREALVSLITNVGITLAGFAMLYYWQTAKALAWSYVASAGLGTLAAIFILKQEFIRVTSNFRKELVKPMLRSSIPIAIIGILGVFTLNIDVIMLGWWRTPEEVGFYSAAQRIVVLLYMLPGILANTLFPQISKAVGEENKEKASRILEHGLGAAFLMSLPLAVGGYAVAGPLINLVFGSEYSPAVSAFKALILTVIAIFPSTLLPSYLLAHNAQGKVAFGVGLGSALDIALNAMLIPTFGILGAATSTTLTHFMSYIYVSYVSNKVNPFSLFKHIWKMILAAIIMGLLSFGLENFGVNVIINILASGLVYAIILFVLKEKIIHELITLFKNNVWNSGNIPSKEF